MSILRCKVKISTICICKVTDCNTQNSVSIHIHIDWSSSLAIFDGFAFDIRYVSCQIQSSIYSYCDCCKFSHNNSTIWGRQHFNSHSKCVSVTNDFMVKLCLWRISLIRNYKLSIEYFDLRWIDTQITITWLFTQFVMAQFLSLSLLLCISLSSCFRILVYQKCGFRKGAKEKKTKGVNVNFI